MSRRARGVDRDGIGNRTEEYADSSIGGHNDVGDNRTPRSRGGHRAEGHGYGLILFASVLLVVAGCFNLIYGIAAIANSHVFTAHAHYVFGNLRAWGWITLILGVVQLLAAAGVLAGSQWARWFAVVVVGLNTIDQMLFLPAYPFWSLMIIAVDVIALYGLCAYGSRENLEAA
jgi:hypothetical protein